MRARWPLAILVSSVFAIASTLLPVFAFDDPPKPAPTDEPKPAASAGEDDDEEFMKRDRFKLRGQEVMDRLDEAYGKDFWTYFFDDGVMPRPYLVAAQKKASFDPDTLKKEYAEILGYLYQEFYRQYRSIADLKDVTEPVTVLVFDSRDDYKKVREDKPDLRLANEEFIAGYYVPSTGILYQWRQSDLWHVMFHEGTHQLVDFATGRKVMQFNESPWFQEGIADFMGGHKSKLVYSEEKKGFVREFQLGQFIADRFQTAQSAILGDYAFSVRELVGMDFMKFKAAQNNQEGDSNNQRITGLVYAQGWALVQFLNNYQGGKYEPMFREFFKAELQGKGNEKSFGEIFLLETDEDWDEFNEEYTGFISTDLRRMRLKVDREKKDKGEK